MFNDASSRIKNKMYSLQVTEGTVKTKKCCKKKKRKCKKI